MEKERYYTLQEVQELLKVSERTVHRWIQSGALPAYKPASLWRVAASDLEAFLEARRGPAPKAPSSSPVPISEELALALYNAAVRFNAITTAAREELGNWKRDNPDRRTTLLEPIAETVEGLYADAFASLAATIAPQDWPQPWQIASLDAAAWVDIMSETAQRRQRELPAVVTNAPDWPDARRHVLEEVKA